ncbi:toxin-antitoxin system protein HicB [Acetobacter ascendens]|uniref:toxin-antitoxin system protein HicB n=1 Tax=Acetobacter ascendens TaxID=481146 RepID=UPI000875D19C|nr:toxin-antitoxin system protein HicB [Acetobacter ascendens]AOW49081.1 toxin-antitoxin system protein HicB [Acetobacter ascendens]
MLVSGRDMMFIGGIPAVISFNASSRMFRGVFIGLNAEVDFLACSPMDLQPQGEAALSIFLKTCRQQNRSPLLARQTGKKGYLLEDIYAELEEPARQKGIDLYQLVRVQTQEFQETENRKKGSAVFLNF